MACESGDLIVHRNGANLDIGNGRVMLRLYVRDGGYVQEFHAIDRAGQFRPVLSSLHKNLIAASDHRVCASPMIAGDRPHLYGVCRESLAHGLLPGQKSSSTMSNACEGQVVGRCPTSRPKL